MIKEGQYDLQLRMAAFASIHKENGGFSIRDNPLCGHCLCRDGIIRRGNDDRISTPFWPTRTAALDFYKMWCSDVGK